MAFGDRGGNGRFTARESHSPLGVDGICRT
jgi:hypothetical protein